MEAKCFLIFGKESQFCGSKRKRFVDTSQPVSRRPIVMLANGHPPFDTRIFLKEARSLAAAGYSVSIILPHTHTEQRDGITIHAVPLIRSGFHKLVISPWHILRKAIAQPARTIYCIHDSDILGVGLLLKLIGRKVIYDAHEDTPLQISYQHWVPKILRKPYAVFYLLLEKLCGWCFDAILVAEPVIAKYFPPSKTFLVRNFPTVAPFRNYSAPAYSQRSRALIYVGTLSKVRGLFEMVDGARLASETLDFEFILGGQFAPPSLEQMVVKSKNLKILPWIQYDKLVELLFSSKIGIIIPNPIERYKTNYPVKLFEFMAAGLPVIASKEGESSDFVKEAQCGILVDPMNTNEIAEAIIWLFQHPTEAESMGKRGQQLIFEKYNWENERQVLLQAYHHASS